MGSMAPKEGGLGSLYPLSGSLFWDVVSPTRILHYFGLDEWGEEGHTGKVIGYLLIVTEPMVTVTK